MQVIAGERAVTIRLSYDEAENLPLVIRRAHRPGSWTWDLATMIAAQCTEGRAKGRPLAPLPKSEIAHNSTVEIVASRAVDPSML